MGRYNLSPSRVARYYFHECDRFLRYSATPQHLKQEEGVPPYQLDHSLLTKAILNSGYDWEGEVLATRLIDSAVIASPPPDKPDAAKTSRVHTAAETIDALRNAAPGQYIYQPTLIATDGFYERYGLDRELVEFGECRPDLLMITSGEDGANKVTVLDLKATDEEKLSHKIQATLYTLILEHLLADHGIPGLATTRQGGVWLYQHESPVLFDLSSVTPPLETFLTNELQPILRAPASEAFWHLYYRCEWCDFYQHCRDKAEATNDVSLVPYLSTFAKRFLAKEAGVHTVDEFGKFLAREDAPEIMQNSASLRGKTRRMALSVDAITTGVEHMTGAASVAMPTWEDVRIILTLQSEPLSGAIYGYAINRLGSGPPKSGNALRVFDKSNETVCRVAPTEGEGDKTALRRSLIGDLMAMLRPVHDFNAEHASDAEWKIRKSVQVYVFDTYERELLVEALLEATHDEDRSVAEDAISLFFHFQHPDLAAAEAHPAKEVFFPLVVLTSVIRSVFALPITVVYRFADVVAELQPSKYPSDYQHNDYFDFELSNRLKSDAIFYVWFKARVDLVPNIEWHLKRRVWATGAVVNGIRERLKPTGALFAWPPKFALPPGAGFRHPLLSRLAFVSRYEYVLAYLAQRASRSAPEPERLAAGDSLKLTFIDGDRYRIDASQPEVEVDADNFYNSILTHDDDGGRKARLSYDDARYRDKQYAPGNQPIALAAVTHEPGLGVIRLRLKRSKEFWLPKKGEVLILEERATDFFTDNLIGELAELDKLDDPWFARLVVDPVGTRRRIVGPTDVMATAKKLATEAGLTPSQLQAFESVVDHDIQLIWGPPGTGKTHFLAIAILCLAEANRRHRLPIRVLITGFTNAAIDNALRKLVDLSEETRIFRGDLPIGRISTRATQVGVAVKPKEAAQFASANPICVLGSTVWQARKTAPADLLYDLVVIDEGSQLEVAETAIPVSRLRPGGRLVIAGDDKQLPPIVQGNYPVPEGEPLLHRSILEAMRERDPEDKTVATLLENFRMCDVLCEYPASSIYPAAYGPATDEIANRRLSFKGSLPDGFLGEVLDPAHPMVMCVMEEATGAAENLKEASLVAAVAVKLRELLPEGSDEEFWAQRLFIVSPHHAQIRAIKRELHRRREWDAEPFVGTVDKMQGQECDVVLVSYGVSDVEYALMEKEFIYSLNRLNVAITRARVKTVVFLSRSLLEPPLQALDRDDVADGIAFMQGLAADPSTLVVSV